MFATDVRAGPMTPVMARVDRVLKETHDTFTLQLAAADGELGRFEPGQFSMLSVFGVAELPISISGDPAETESHTYTVRSVGQATLQLVRRKPGDWLGVRGPFGVGWPMDAARGKDVILIGGGIGLAPLRPALYRLFHQRRDYGRVILLYGSRSPRDLLFRREIAAWKRQPGVQIMVTVDYGGLSWQGNVGVVTSLFRYVRLDPSRTVALLCGPEVMIRYVAMELEQKGVSANDIYPSMERNMKCGIGLCGHCQFGPQFICKDGPVFPYARVRHWIERDET